MNPEMSFKVLIIGAGNIAQGFDEPNTSEVRTHLNGYLFYDDFFDVDSIFDTDSSKVRAIAEKWGIRNYFTEFEQLESKYFDVISICTPDNTHEYYLDKALLMMPKVIFIEKPLALTSEKAKDVFSYCLTHKILLVVNYSRMFLEEFRSLRDSFHANKMGKVLSVTIRYHKGFYHNCSHFFNLLIFILKPSYSKSLVMDAIFDYSPEDPSISGIVVFKIADYEFRLNFEAVDYSRLNMTEVDFMFERNRVVYVESKGSWLHTFRTESYFDGIELKEYVSESTKLINYNGAMINAIGLIKNFLSYEDLNTIKEYGQISLATTEVMETVFKEYNYSKQNL